MAKGTLSVLASPCQLLDDSLQHRKATAIMTTLSHPFTSHGMAWHAASCPTSQLNPTQPSPIRPSTTHLSKPSTAHHPPYPSVPHIHPHNHTPPNPTPRIHPSPPPPQPSHTPPQPSPPQPSHTPPQPTPSQPNHTQPQPSPPQPIHTPPYPSLLNPNPSPPTPPQATPTSAGGRVRSLFRPSQRHSFAVLRMGKPTLLPTCPPTRLSARSPAKSQLSYVESAASHPLVRKGLATEWHKTVTTSGTYIPLPVT